MTKGEKLKRTLAEQSARFAAQTIQVDSNWQIVRFDAMNWQIQHKEHGKWCEYGFYGKLPAALQALAGKMLSDEASGSLQDLLGTLRAIRERVDDALQNVADKYANHLLDQ